MTDTNIKDINNKGELPVVTPQGKATALSTEKVNYITRKVAIMKRGLKPRNTTFGNSTSLGSSQFINIIPKEEKE